jgi:3-oxoacyl-[acyl-carrier protein] reductase
MRLYGRIAIVTGAAGGLGKAIARRFLDEGASLCLVDRLDTTAELSELEVEGHQAIAINADLTDSAAVNEVMRRTVDQYGRVDVLVNLAGVGSHGACCDITDEEWRRVIDCNLSSVFYCCRAVLPFMRQQGYGRIVNIG